MRHGWRDYIRNRFNNLAKLCPSAAIDKKSPNQPVLPIAHVARTLLSEAFELAG